MTNIGGREGSHLVSLWIDEVLEETKEVILAPEAVKIITFTVTREEAGTYSVTVDRLTGSFTVKEKVVPPVIPKPINWPLLGGIIGGLIALGLLVYFLVVRGRMRRGK